MKRALVILLAISGTVAAQPAPAPAPPSEADLADAKQLMQDGVKLLESKDYAGALFKFQDAYHRYPSAKILLNIGTTLKLLERKAEAANAYQRYLDSSDADPARKADVQAALADLDKWLGTITVTLDPPDAELAVDGEWLRGSRVVHVAPGGVVLQARRDGYQPAQRQVSVVGGQQLPVAIALQPIAAAKPAVAAVVTAPHEEVHEAAPAPEARSRIGALAMAHVSVSPKLGSAWLVGATADVTPLLAVEGAVWLGPGLVSGQGNYMYAPPAVGGYGGVSLSFLSGAWHPRAAAGLLVIGDGGARFALRGAGGVEYVASRHVSVILELGIEANLNPRSDIDRIAIVPALAASARL